MTTHITLVTQEDCGSCDQAKEVLHRLAEELDLQVRVVGLDDAEGRSLAEGGGLAFPPGVFIDHELFSYGRLSERKLRRHLRRRAEAQETRPRG